MDDLLSEKEQIEQIRTWWSEYGGYVIAGLAIGIAILFGTNYYQSSKLNAQLEASALYESLTERVVAGRLEGAEKIAADIEANFATTTYAAQAKLAMARLYMDRNRDQDAADVLSGLLNSEAGDEIKHVARARLARIMLYQDRAEDVLELLAGHNTGAFAPIYGELRGDAYAALDRYADAQAAYQQVLMDPSSRGVIDQELVQWKALDLPEEVAAVEAEVEQPVEAEAAAEAAPEEGE